MVLWFSRRNRDVAFAPISSVVAALATVAMPGQDRWWQRRKRWRTKLSCQQQSFCDEEFVERTWLLLLQQKGDDDDDDDDDDEDDDVSQICFLPSFLHTSVAAALSGTPPPPRRSLHHPGGRATVAKRRMWNPRDANKTRDETNMQTLLRAYLSST